MLRGPNDVWKLVEDAKRVLEQNKKEKEKKRRKRKERRIGKEKKRKRKKERKEREIDELIILQKEEKIVGALERKKRKWKKKIKVGREVWSWLEKGVPLLFEKGKRPRIIKEIRMEKEAEEVLKKYIKEHSPNSGVANLCDSEEGERQMEGDHRSEICQPLSTTTKVQTRELGDFELTTRAKMDLLEWLEILGNWNGQALIRRPIGHRVGSIPNKEQEESGRALFNSKWR